MTNRIKKKQYSEQSFFLTISFTNDIKCKTAVFLSSISSTHLLSASVGVQLIKDILYLYSAISSTSGDRLTYSLLKTSNEREPPPLRDVGEHAQRARYSQIKSRLKIRHASRRNLWRRATYVYETRTLVIVSGYSFFFTCSILEIKEIVLQPFTSIITTLIALLQPCYPLPRL